MSTEAAPPPATTTVPAETPAAAAAAAPTTTTPLAKLTARLAEITTKADYKEMWGVELDTTSAAAAEQHIPSQVILQKFLRANGGDAEAAEKQLTSALEWRKKMQPAKLVEEHFDKAKFEDLGYVTVHKDDAGKETVITWNIYGAVKDNKATFGNVEEFIRWRSALMELSVQKLKLNDVKALIPEGGEDPYQMIQTHDYLNVSFFRMDPAVKAASKETIQTLSMAYPELLAHKYFVNVPFIMGWMFGAMKLFLAPATLRKFHPMTSGTTLASELPTIVSSLPAEYGGKGPAVKEAGQQLLFAEAPVASPPVEEEAKEEEHTPAAAAAAPAAAVAEETPVAEPEAAAAAPAAAVVADKSDVVVADQAEETTTPTPAAAAAPEASTEVAAATAEPTAAAAAEKPAAEKEEADKTAA